MPERVRIIRFKERRIGDLRRGKAIIRVENPETIPEEKVDHLSCLVEDYTRCMGLQCGEGNHFSRTGNTVFDIIHGTEHHAATTVLTDLHHEDPFFEDCFVRGTTTPPTASNESLVAIVAKGTLHRGAIEEAFETTLDVVNRLLQD